MGGGGGVGARGRGGGGAGRPGGAGEKTKNIERSKSIITCGVCISQRVFRSRVFTTKELVLA
jgi:hypothetical protein